MNSVHPGFIDTPLLHPELGCEPSRCSGTQGELPRPLAEAVVLAAGSSGVSLTSPASMMADPASPRSGLRVCLGGPSWADLSRGLAIVRDVLDQAAHVQLGAAAV